MTIRSMALPVGTLLAGIAIGWLLPRGTHNASPANSASDGQPAPVRTRAVDRADGPEVEGLTGADAGRINASPIPGDAENKRDMIRVPSSLIGELSRAAGTRTNNQDLFSRDGLVEKALGITDHEKADIQTAWRTSRQKIRDLETASMKSVAIDEWTVRITVPDLSQAMVPLETDFRSSVHRALGEDRSEAFLAAKQVDGMFTPPAGDRCYTVTSESIGDGRWRYRMTLETPAGNRVWVGENIPDEIRHLTNAARVQSLLDP